jgi:hypothetical protein
LCEYVDGEESEREREREKSKQSDGMKRKAPEVRMDKE